MFILYFFKACGWYFAYGLWFKQLDLKIQGSLMSQQKKDINFSTFSSHPPMALFSNILFSTYCMPGTVVILFSSVQFSSVAQSCPTLQPHGLQHIRLLCPSPPPRAYPNSCPLSPWCHPTISFSVVPFSSHLQSFPALGSFKSQFLASGCQSIGVSASASVLQMNIQDWFPLGWTGWIFLQSTGFSRVFSNTTFQKHQFFGDQLSL